MREHTLGVNEGDGSSFTSAAGLRVLDRLRSEHSCGYAGCLRSIPPQMTPEWIKFKPRGDERGTLVAIEGGRDVPFEIKRVYTLTSMSPGGIRGGHAHKMLRQVIVCLSGSCTVDLDNGSDHLSVTLNDAACGLCLEPMIWHEMRDFSPGCVLMVLAADHYDEPDYIRDRNEFLKRAVHPAA